MRSLESPAEDQEPLVDTTAMIPLRSKRTERKQKQSQEKNKARKNMSILDLPSELVIDILGCLRPSDVYNISRVSRSWRQFTLQNEAEIANEIIKSRYQTLAKCLQLPVLLDKVDKCVYPALQSAERQEMLNIHKKPYQHIKPPNPHIICTCLRCILAWNYLCVAVDLAHWQDNLDQGEPLPIIPRGESPVWNQNIISVNAAIVEKALHNPLWYARLLEEHLRSTVRSIRRHEDNKGDKRKCFPMSKEDAASDTDRFLERRGPASMEIPYQRDNYYILQAFVPNRVWNPSESRWLYGPASQHDRDLEFVKAWAMRNSTVAQVSDKT